MEKVATAFGLSRKGTQSPLSISLRMLWPRPSVWLSVGPKVDHRLGDIQTWPWTTQRYDAVVAIFIQFLSPDDREGVFAGMKSAVKPDGLFFLRVTDQNKWTMTPAGQRDVITCIHETGSSSSSPAGRYSC
jgi:hypothetical protein